VNNDACLNACADADCGDAVIWQGQEECDDGNGVQTDNCLDTCLDATCGDSYVWNGQEECDDGNDDNDDACLQACEAASCGDGYVWQGVEDCDDGNLLACDSCNAECIAPAGLAWEQTYDQDGFQFGRRLAVDSDGEVFVASDTSVFKLDAQGQLAWHIWLEVNYRPAWVAIGPNDEVYFVGTEPSVQVLWMAEYDQSGGEVWSVTYDYTASQDRATGAALSPEGDLVVTGWSVGETLVGKYDASDGSEIWTTTYDADPGRDEGRAVAVAADGEIIVGAIKSNSYNVVVVKYTADGDLLWELEPGGRNLDDIDVDDDGNIYIVKASADFDAVLERISPDGEVVWSIETTDVDFPNVEVDCGGVIAHGYETVGFQDYETLTRKYTQDGDVVWSRTHEVDEGEGSWGYGMDVDSSGNVVIGSLSQSNAPHNFSYLAYSP
jgi:cysteine-rich repeat protein